MPVQAWFLPDPVTYGAVNTARAEYLGLKKEDLERRAIWDILPEEEATICIRGNEEVFQGKKTIRTEEWVRNACGEVRLLVITKKPVLDDAGNVISAVCTAEDITDRRRAEDTARRRDTILDAVGFVADALMKQGEWSDEIPEILRRLGEATGASRVHLFENSGTAREGPCPPCQEWTAAGIMPLGKHLPDHAGIFSADGTPQWYADLAAGRPVAARAGEFPEKARRHLSSGQILSLAEIPLLIEGEWWGCLGLEDCREEREWSGAEIDALRTAARIIGAAIQRQRFENLYRLPVMYSSSGIYLAQGGTFRYVNPGFGTIFGYTEEEVVGQMCHADIILRDDLPRFQEIMQSLLSRAMAMARDDFRGLGKDGRLLFLEHFGTRTLYRGRPAVLGTFIDRTAQKQAETALTESEEKYRELFNNVKDAIFLIEITHDNQLGRLIEVNPAACTYLQYPREELLLMSPGEIEDPKAQASHARSMEILLLHGEAAFESALVRRDGSTVPVEIRCNLFELAGKPVVLAVARDITERIERQKKEAEAFRQIEKNMEQFAILNDHIRNPLQVILGLACLYDETVGDRIATEVREIDALVNGLDQGWLQSEKIRAVLRRHYGMILDGTARHQAG
ncbi:MAG: PAS domain S-box protein [Methanofollis sp.]|uniref:PAS domain S-box protein n=1 Tax=Methanofollis sp. TaxID=2052835 RepID=UPI00260241E9|nr:PAS domain S-box protein [Methanofollis sp.]MDD4254023.1 PAS domain S-box protein [Methanofollis sp.]